jgi:hypothetical protein
MTKIIFHAIMIPGKKPKKSRMQAGEKTEIPDYLFFDESGLLKW